MRRFFRTTTSCRSFYISSCASHFVDSKALYADPNRRAGDGRSCPGQVSKIRVRAGGRPRGYVRASEKYFEKVRVGGTGSLDARAFRQGRRRRRRRRGCITRARDVWTVSARENFYAQTLRETR